MGSAATRKIRSSFTWQYITTQPELIFRESPISTCWRRPSCCVLTRIYCLNWRSWQDPFKTNVSISRRESWRGGWRALVYIWSRMGGWTSKTIQWRTIQWSLLDSQSSWSWSPPVIRDTLTIGFPTTFITFLPPTTLPHFKGWWLKTLAPTSLHGRCSSTVFCPFYFRGVVHTALICYRRKFLMPETRIREGAIRPSTP